MISYNDLELAIDVSNFREIELILCDSSKQYVLKNPSFSIYYFGLEYITSLKNYIIINYPDIKTKFVCDVGSSCSLAMHAIEKNFKYILFSGNDIIKKKLQSIAADKAIIL